MLVVIQAERTPNGDLVVSGEVIVPLPPGGVQRDTRIEARFAVDTQAAYSTLSGDMVRKLGLTEEHLQAQVPLDDFEGKSHRLGLVPGFVSVKHEMAIFLGPMEVTQFGLAFAVSLKDLGRAWDGIGTERWDKPDSLLGKDALHFLSPLKSGRDSAWKYPVVRYELTREAAKLPTRREKGSYRGGYRVRTVCSEHYLRCMESSKGPPTTRNGPYVLRSASR